MSKTPKNVKHSFKTLKSTIFCNFVQNRAFPVSSHKRNLVVFEIIESCLRTVTFIIGQFLDLKNFDFREIVHKTESECFLIQKIKYFVHVACGKKQSLY